MYANKLHYGKNTFNKTLAAVLYVNTNCRNGIFSGLFVQLLSFLFAFLAIELNFLNNVNIDFQNYNREIIWIGIGSFLYKNLESSLMH